MNSMTKEEAKKQIIENNKKISNLLESNEVIAREVFDLNPPIKNYRITDSKQKIQMPKKYIRRANDFRTRYHLSEIVNNKVIEDNMIYAIQYTDFSNFIINRINIWGPIKSIFIKYAVILHISIMEELILQCINNICSPSNCPYINKCDIHMNNKQRNSSYEGLIRLNELSITKYDENELQNIKEIIDLRNKVHIRLSDQNEFTADIYNMDLHNKSISEIGRLDKFIYENGVSFYKDCQYKKER